jgi:hypothetical protein
MLRPLSSFLLVVAFAPAWPALALAGEPAISTADPAQVLFDRGVADMEAGLFEKACPAIEASQRLDPRPGTLFTLAECEAQRGRTATAMRYYSEYLSLYRTFNSKKKVEQKERATISEQQLRKLEASAPRLTLKLPPQSSPDVVVKRDGNVVAELSLGVAFAVDPGEHVITTEVPGGAEVEHRVTLAAGQSMTLTLEVRRDVAPSPDMAPAQSAGPVILPGPSLPPPPPPAVSPWKIGAASAGTVGIVGIVVGAVTGALAIEQRGVMDRNCHTDGGSVKCNATGMDARQRLVSFGDMSTAAFVAGGIGAGISLTLVVTAPSAPTPPPSVGRLQASGATMPQFGLSVSGAF